MGKTAFLISTALNLLEKGERVAFFSLEMSTQLIITRFLSQMTGIPFTKIRQGTLSSEEYMAVKEAGEILKSYPFFILERGEGADLSPQRFRAKVEMLKKTKNISVVFLDYIQMMQTRRKYDSRQQEVTYISQTIKKTALTNDVLLFAASQLSREVEKRKDKRPLLSDLRESGSLEQDADIVMFLHREDYYTPVETTVVPVEIIVEKNRNGPCGTAHLRFRKDTMQFTDPLDEIHVEEEIPW